MPEVLYERHIRWITGEVWKETLTQEEEVGSAAQITSFTHLDGKGRTVGTLVTRYDPREDLSRVVEDTMPAGWDPPPEGVIEHLRDRYRGTPLDVTRNVVTFVTPMRDGRMQLQQRSYVSPQGKPIGNPGMLSINGGLMEHGDVEANVVREGYEELGVDIRGHFRPVGSTYDPEMGRSNHVFALTTGYDTLLIQQCSVEQAVRALTEPEGLGRAFVWRDDLVALLAAGGLTPISARILRLYPELMPPTRPG